MKQLIEEQREEYVRIASYTNEYGYLHKIPKYEDVWNWHKQSLKQFIDGLIEETKKLIVNRPESLIKLNAHLDSRTQQHQYSRAVGYCEAVDKGVAHLKKLKEELN